MKLSELLEAIKNSSMELRVKAELDSILRVYQRVISESQKDEELIFKCPQCSAEDLQIVFLGYIRSKVEKVKEEELKYSQERQIDRTSESRFICGQCGFLVCYDQEILFSVLKKRGWIKKAG